MCNSHALTFKQHQFTHMNNNEEICLSVKAADFFPLFFSHPCFSHTLPLGILPSLVFIHRHHVTEAGTTGILFTEMPQTSCPLGAVPEPVFHNQVRHKQPHHSPPAPNIHLNTLLVELSIEVYSQC